MGQTVIAGGADKLTPSAHARDLAAGIPRAMLVHEPGAGHMLLHDAPDLVTDAISRALTRSGEPPTPQDVPA